MPSGWPPSGYLVTWQGYGHCLKVTKHATPLLKAYKEAKKNQTLPQYTNAVAKYACMSKILSYLETGEGVEDGHTCLLPEPIPLGKAAVKALGPDDDDDDGGAGSSGDSSDNSSIDSGNSSGWALQQKADKKSGAGQRAGEMGLRRTLKQPWKIYEV